MGLDYDYVLEFASRKHSGQFRKDKVTPYIEHPKKVAELVSYYKSHSSHLQELVAASLLHDTFEDTYTSYRELVDEFGELVASLVHELTTASYMVKMLGKAQYLEKKMVAMSDYALVIKLADRLANVMDSKSLTLGQQAKLRSDTDKILDYLVANRQLTNSQTRLYQALREELDKNLPIAMFVGTKYEDLVKSSANNINL